VAARKNHIKPSRSLPPTAPRPAAAAPLARVSISFENTQLKGDYCLSKCETREVVDALDCLRQMCMLTWLDVMGRWDTAGSVGRRSPTTACERRVRRRSTHRMESAKFVQVRRFEYSGFGTAMYFMFSGSTRTIRTFASNRRSSRSVARAPERASLLRGCCERSWILRVRQEISHPRFPERSSSGVREA
jgi:hypothetical protein